MSEARQTRDRQQKYARQAATTRGALLFLCVLCVRDMVEGNRCRTSRLYFLLYIIFGSASLAAPVRFLFAPY
jgi:hypothetical protein